MTSEELHAMWKAKPFHPFRAVMVDGRRYDVTHPWHIVVGRGFWHFFFQEARDVPFDRVDVLSPAYIDHVEDLSTATTPLPQNSSA